MEAELNSNVPPATQPVLQHPTVAPCDGRLSVCLSLKTFILTDRPPPPPAPGLGEKHLSFVCLNLAQADEEGAQPGAVAVPSAIREAL